MRETPKVHNTKSLLITDKMCQINDTDDCKKLCNSLLLNNKWTIRRDRCVLSHPALRDQVFVGHYQVIMS